MLSCRVWGSWALLLLVCSAALTATAQPSAPPSDASDDQQNAARKASGLHSPQACVSEGIVARTVRSLPPSSACCTRFHLILHLLYVMVSYLKQSCCSSALPPVSEASAPASSLAAIQQGGVAAVRAAADISGLDHTEVHRQHPFTFYYAPLTPLTLLGNFHQSLPHLPHLSAPDCMQVADAVNGATLLGVGGSGW